MAAPQASPRRTPVFVITGTSGAGKGTLVKALLERVPELALSVSATTRARRPGEEHGRHYYFLSDEDFDRRLDDGEFLEWVPFPWGQRSGTLWSEITRIHSDGRAPLLELETRGALDVEARVPGTVTIFVSAPSFEELERRLRERATESSGEIEERLDLAREQLAQKDAFDYEIVNDDLERATAELAEIVERELDAASRSLPASRPVVSDGPAGKAGAS